MACVLAAGGYSATRVFATGSLPGFPAPGVQDDMAAMRALPQATDVPPDILHAVQDAAARAGGDPAGAVASLRVLLPNVGLTHYRLYGFKGGGGEVCLILWRSAGTCPQGARTWDKGIVVLLAGGTPPTVSGQQPEAPPAVVGIVSDEVASLTLVGAGGSEDLPMRNNAFFRELPNVPAGPSAAFQLLVRQTDGSTETIDLPYP